MNRFWVRAEVTPGFGVALDGKPVRVPGAGPLRVGSEALAQAIAAEWQAAPDAFSHEDLPLTRLAGTAQERVARDPGPVALELARYAESDLLCYRAETPAALAERQAAEWQLWLDWAEDRYGARLVPTVGIRHVPQDPRALAVLAAAVARSGVATLTGLGIVVPSLGSLVLGMAVAEGALDIAAAHALATIDESFQAEFWGSDTQALARTSRVAGDLAVAARYIRLAAS